MIIKAIKDINSDLLQEVLEILYESFPEEEREEDEKIKERLMMSVNSRLQNGKSFHVLAGSEGGVVVAFSIYLYNANYGLGFLAYFATDQKVRGRGYGTKMFKGLLKHLQTIAEQYENELKGLCWQLERPKDVSDEKEVNKRKRRIHFYEKNGGILLPWINFKEPLKEDGVSCYYLMYHPSSSNQENRITPLLQKNIIDYLYLDCYEVNEQDKDYISALKSVK